MRWQGTLARGLAAVVWAAASLSPARGPVELTAARARPMAVRAMALRASSPADAAPMAGLGPVPGPRGGRHGGSHSRAPTVHRTSGPGAEEILLAARRGPVVSRYLFGANLLWAYNAEGSFDARTGRFYPGFVSLLRRLGVTAVRYPGGTTSDSFFWQRAIGPLWSRLPNEPYGMQAARTSPICCVLDGPAPSTVGPDEFGRLLGQLGATGTVTVNFGSGTAQQAADFVAYLTARLPRKLPPGPPLGPSSPGYWAALRARNGHPAPYDVRYWEVGNEQLFPGQYGWRSGRALSLGPGGGGCPADQVPTCLYIYGGTTAFYHQRVGRFADQLPLASISDGAPGQVFYTYFPPVVPRSLRVYVGGRQWREVRHLVRAAQGAHVFALDARSGAVTFGNGRHGAVPSAGALVTVSYDSGPHQGFLEFYRAMKHMVPRARVCESEETDLAFLAIMGRRHRYDCVALHLYARPTATTGPLGLYEHQLMASVPAEGRTLALVQSAVRRYSGRNVPVVLTEYGQLVAPVPVVDPQFNLSLEEGLFSAAQLFEWMAHGVPLAERYLAVSAPFPLRRFSTVIDTNTAMVATGLSVYSAMVVHRGPRFVAEPTGEVLGLLRSFAGSRLLSLVRAERAPWHAPGQVYMAAALAPTGHVLLGVVNAGSRLSLAVQARSLLTGRSCQVDAAVLDGPSATAYNTPLHPATVAVHHQSAPVPCGQFRWTFPAHSLSVLQVAPRPGPLVALTRSPSL